MVFGPEGEMLRHNEQWEQLSGDMDLDNGISSLHEFVQATGLKTLGQGEQERVQELPRKGRTLLVRQRICSMGSGECTAMLIDDITGFRDTMRSVTGNTLNALWKIRSRATGIQNALSLLAEYSAPTLSGDDRSLLRDSLFETWQLTRYCNNLRDMTALESGIIEINAEPCSLKRALDAAVGNVMVYVGYQHQKCIIQAPVSGEIRVTADWSRLVHILDAVILNSVMYSTAEIRIDIAAHREPGQVLLLIKDNGMGIDKEDLGRVFLAGFRGANAATVDYNGMGMELYLARQMLMRMNGSINIYSRPGAGTTVEIGLETAGES
jgi:K+-sensing histidine kinase KdpD